MRDRDAPRPPEAADQAAPIVDGMRPLAEWLPLVAQKQLYARLRELDYTAREIRERTGIDRWTWRIA